MAHKVRQQLPSAPRRLVSFLQFLFHNVRHRLVERAALLLRVGLVAGRERVLHDRLRPREDLPARLLEEVLVQLLLNAEVVLLLAQGERPVVVGLVLVPAALLALDDGSLAEVRALVLEAVAVVGVGALIRVVVVAAEGAALDLVLLEDLHVRVFDWHFVDEKDRVVYVVVILLLDLEHADLAL